MTCELDNLLLRCLPNPSFDISGILSIGETSSSSAFGCFTAAKSGELGDETSSVYVCF